ncbi:hypothetical protein [Streptomyces prunicolor]|uniref:hypothetical protein n=1 Tax=Streptomyces prunicolor TaxID=67348 RepID=UPI00157A3E22|nr:hypothetical protein [Streptomyces prunicolor]
MAAVVGLTFLFGFGNVPALARQWGVTPWVAPLVAPAVDLSVIGLLLGTGHLALRGANRARLRPERRLLVFSSLIALVLNVTEPRTRRTHRKSRFRRRRPPVAYRLGRSRSRPAPGHQHDYAPG